VKTLSATGPIQFEGGLDEPGTLTINGKTVPLNASNAFAAGVTLAPGINTVPLVATDGSSNTATKNYQVTIADAQTRMPSYDLNGNLTDDDAGRTFDWDGANRLVKITQGSNVTEFIYDGVGRRVQEKLNGAVIKQWVWDGTAPAEERDAGNTVTKRFYAAGEQIGSSAYFFTTDHLGSVREMTDSTGAIRARYDYDPYGRVTKVSGDLEADFGFTGFYRHQASGLWLTLYRAYDANLGRWLSRDPIGEFGGLNLYEYSADDPINGSDPLGLKTCTGKARVLKGNPRTIGKTGGLYVPVQSGTAAVDPAQWGGKSNLRKNRTNISGSFVDSSGASVSFNGISDVIGGTPPPGYDNIRDFLKSKYPDSLLIELPSGAKDYGTVNITLEIPDSMNCPQGTTEVKPTDTKIACLR
jgi:RHS repeat-associated protein